MIKFRSFAFLLASFLLLSCSNSFRDHHSETPVITVSILPQSYFVKRIAQEKWSVNILIPPGYNPATYEPTSGQMKILKRTKLYFRMGYLPFETGFMENLKQINKGMKIVDTSEGVPLIFQDSHSHARSISSHDRNGSVRGVDPHIWLSPVSVKIISRNILDALINQDPENRDFYYVNLNQFMKDIDDLDRDIRSILSHRKRKKFMVFHPAWSYFAREYGLTQIPIEIDGKHPKISSLKHIIDIARKEDIRTIFVQKQFDTHSARTIAREINAKVILLDPLAKDWMNNMRHIANALANSLK